MDYKTLFADLNAQMDDKKIELAAIKAFLGNEKLTVNERVEIELHSLQVWKDLKELELKYDWHYKLAVESGKW